MKTQSADKNRQQEGWRKQHFSAKGPSKVIYRVALICAKRIVRGGTAHTKRDVELNITISCEGTT